MSIIKKSNRSFLLSVLVSFWLGSSSTYGISVDDFMSKCDFQISTSSGVYPKFMERIFREPKAYIAKQIYTICQS